MTKPAIQSVKLAKLQLSAINVRTPENDLIEQLAADVDARGVIQNLIVAPLKKPRGSFAVIAGSRRYRALMLLSERGQIDPAQYDVPVMVIEADDAALSETSLAENFHHLAMSPADECRAFQHFIGENGDLDAVAKRFGVTRKFVEGRLRLADLAEPIFNALAEGKITLDMAKAYATTPSHDRQLTVWNSYKNYNCNSDAIRRVILNETIKSTEPVANLVGANRYIAAGGVIESDLFSDTGDSWVSREIAEGIAAKITEEEAARLAKSWAWPGCGRLHRAAPGRLPASFTG